MIMQVMPSDCVDSSQTSVDCVSPVKAIHKMGNAASSGKLLRFENCLKPNFQVVYLAGTNVPPVAASGHRPIRGETVAKNANTAT